MLALIEHRIFVFYTRTMFIFLNLYVNTKGIDKIKNVYNVCYPETISQYTKQFTTDMDMK